MTEPGPAVLFGIWFVCVTVLGIFGSGEFGGKALAHLGTGGAFLIGALGVRGFK